MPDIVFLDHRAVVQIHTDQIERYGGSPEVRDPGLLDSAIAAIEASYEGVFLHESLPAMGAAYMYHLIQNHPFVDGNKRTGSMCAIVFLNLNQADLDASNEQLAELAYSIAAGVLTKAQVTEQIEKMVVAYNPGSET